MEELDEREKCLTCPCLGLAEERKTDLILLLRKGKQRQFWSIKWLSAGQVMTLNLPDQVGIFAADLKLQDKSHTYGSVGRNSGSPTGSNCHMKTRLHFPFPKCAEPTSLITNQTGALAGRIHSFHSPSEKGIYYNMLYFKGLRTFSHAIRHGKPRGQCPCTTLMNVNWIESFLPPDSCIPHLSPGSLSHFLSPLFWLSRP